MNKELYVVGVGASAGGLKAITAFLTSIEDDKANFCIIVVQHMLSSHKSELSNILRGKIASWKVEEAKDDVLLERNTVYVSPSDSTITFDNGRIELVKSERDEHPSPSVDIFFESLASNFQSRAIGVVLSGTGDDGMRGFQNIKVKGGMTIAQLPYTAQNQEMPENAALYSDFQLAPEDIYYEILQYIDNHQIIGRLSEAQEQTQYILGLLKEKTGTNFTKYKTNTIDRRIRKRIETLKLDDLTSYYKHLRENPAELDILFETVLIGVTEFFRDKAAFEEYRKYLEHVLQDKQKGDTIRIWSVGCATGEEAYSVAIMLFELLGDEIRNFNVQIFATDIDDKALKKGRRGFFSKEQLNNVPDALKKKYFIESDHGFEVIKNVRQYILFSKHDITTDPPFVKLDSIICRNLLIYFKTNLQKDVLKIFHYALNHDGILFLGKSENASIMSDLFEQMPDAKKIYKKDDGTPLNTLTFSKFRRRNKSTEESAPDEQRPKELSLLDYAKETIYSSYLESPFVIINDNHQIKEIKGSMKLYMELGEGPLDGNIFKMLQGELSMELRLLLAKLSKDPKLYKGSIIQFSVFDRDYHVRLSVSPLYYGRRLKGYTMVLFEHIDVDPKYISFQESYTKEQFKDLRNAELEQELAAAKEHIQTFTEELETSNEELQSLNEELQSANEELKSSNEELETSNEELQSTNEELQTSNAELRTINKELIRKEKQLERSKGMLEKSEYLYKTLAENYPNGTIGLVSKDHKVDFISGQDMEKLGFDKVSMLGKLFYKNLDKKEQEKLKKLFDMALEGEKIHSFFMAGNMNFMINMIPLTFNRKIEQVLFVTQNITEHSKLIKDLEESETRFRVIADAAPVMIWMCDDKMKCSYVNAGWTRFTGRKPEDEMGNGWLDRIHPDDKDAVVSLFRRNFHRKMYFTMEYRLMNHENEYRFVLHNSIPHYSPDGRFNGFIGGCADIHRQKMMEIKKDEFLNIASHELNTPLTTLRVYLDLIAEEVEKIEDGKIKKYLEKSENSASKLEKLIRELLEVSRIELGKLKYKEQTINVDQFIGDLTQDYQKLLDKHKIVVKNKTEKRIKGDPELLEQVINNLISNASKFSDTGKEIIINLKSQNKHAIVEVKDHGIGIPGKEVEHIFDRFYQVNNPNYRKGLGLGLYLCKQIVDLHRGDISVESKEEEGSTFIVKLPSIN